MEKINLDLLHFMKEYMPIRQNALSMFLASVMLLLIRR